MKISVLFKGIVLIIEIVRTILFFNFVRENMISNDQS
jgi:hypothetical protein